MMIWQIKDTSASNYYKMPSPSSYSIGAEDLEADSYRSIATGNIIRNIVSKNWSNLSFSYSFLSPDGARDILNVLNRNPIYVKALDPVLGNTSTEMEMYCASKSLEMLETGDYSLSFDLVQQKKVSGQ